MEFSELQTFVKVVQTGSFTRAAELLGSNKAHVSRVISSLERKLKAQLLQRSTRALHLTEFGREVFERAIGILSAVEDTERMALQQQAAPVGLLKLTCGPEFGMLRVNGWLNSYLEAFPQVSAEVEYTSRVVDLVHEGFDLAIRIGPLQDSGLSARKLIDLEYGLYASPDYLARMGEPRSPQELEQGHELLVFSSGAHRAGWHLRRGSEECRVNAAARLRINNSFGVREAAVHGLGVAKLPEIVAHRALAGGQLVRLLPEWVSPSVPVNAVFASSRYLSPKLRAFIDHVIAIAADEEAPYF